MPVALASMAANVAKKAATELAQRGKKGGEKKPPYSLYATIGAVVAVFALVLSLMNGASSGIQAITVKDSCDDGLFSNLFGSGGTDPNDPEYGVNSGNTYSVDASGALVSGSVGSVASGGYVVHGDYVSAGYSGVGSSYNSVNPENTSRVVYPYSGGAMTTSSTYGWRIHPVTGVNKFHAGQDIARTGDFNSIADGIVVNVYDPSDSSISPVITIKHKINGKIYFSEYLHWSKSYVKVGDVVKAGQAIAITGTRGPSTGVHLHLQIADGAENNIIDPSKFLTSMGATTDYASDGNGGTVTVVDASTQCNTGDLGGTMSSGARAIILAAARSQIGVPYVWGAEAEGSAFDCSGLTKYAYGKAGFTLPHQSQQQYNMVKKITQAEAQPGDLVFWGAPSGVYHVAIYAGNGKIIEAPLPGSNVREVPIYGIVSFGTLEGLNGTGASGDAKTYAQSLVGSMWTSSSTSEFQCLDKLWTKESSWDYTATNASSGAYGIPQALPGSKMASAGSDWKTNPQTQINWGLNYIKGRYGSPCAAWAHSQSVNWY